MDEDITITTYTPEYFRVKETKKALEALCEDDGLYDDPLYEQRFLEAIKLLNPRDGERREKLEKLMEVTRKAVKEEISMENPGEWVKHIRELRKIMHNTRIKKGFELLDGGWEDIKVYALRPDSPFKVLIEPNQMLLRNGIMTIGGKAGAGKTSFATQLAMEILSVNPDTCFILFSLDDSEDLSKKRILSQILGDNFMRPGKITDNPEEMQNIRNALKDTPFPRLTIVSEGGCLESIEYIIEEAKQEGNYKYVVFCFDYVQMLKFENVKYGDDDKRATLNIGLREIKRIQKSTNSLFMILSQLKRGSNGKEEFGYRETSEIENISDICIDITEPPRTKEEIDSGEGDAKRLIRISKNKLGRKGNTYATEINEIFTFSELTKYVPPVEDEGFNKKSNKSRYFGGK